jgi:hypothetical protein
MDWSAKEVSAVVVAIIAAAVSLIGALINVYVSRRSTYLNAVTAERSKWIDKLRTNISTFSGLVRTLYFRLLADKAFFRTPEYYDLVKQVNGLIPLIKLQLNPAGEIDRHLVSLLDRIPYLAENPQNDMLIRADTLLIEHSQWLLKAEWEKVKSEARWVLGFGPWVKQFRHLSAYRRFCQAHDIASVGAAIPHAP